MATILVIDDQEPIRALLRAALEGDGHEVLEAANGLLGLERYRERAADRGGSGWLDSLFPFLSGASRVADYAAVSRVVRLS
jgi:CheY-like chemotaxis protein